MTAYAAARVPASAELAEDAAPLIASMLSAGLDRDAAAWSQVVEVGSDAWAMIALGTANPQLPIPSSDIEAFYSDDDSEDARKSQFLLAGLAGLGRVAQADLASLQDSFETDFDRQTAWSRRISIAADYRNEGLVALLAGLGMQGSSWDQMTPLHLYHIVSALNQVGMSAEARMIAWRQNAAQRRTRLLLIGVIWLARKKRWAIWQRLHALLLKALQIAGVIWLRAVLQGRPRRCGNISLSRLMKVGVRMTLRPHCPSQP